MNNIWYNQRSTLYIRFLTFVSNIFVMKHDSMNRQELGQRTAGCCMGFGRMEVHVFSIGIRIIRWNVIMFYHPPTARNSRTKPRRQRPAPLGQLPSGHPLAGQEQMVSLEHFHSFHRPKQRVANFCEAVKQKRPAASNIIKSTSVSLSANLMLLIN